MCDPRCCIIKFVASILLLCPRIIYIPDVKDLSVYSPVCNLSYRVLQVRYCSNFMVFFSLPDVYSKIFIQYSLYYYGPVYFITCVLKNPHSTCRNSIVVYFSVLITCSKNASFLALIVVSISFVYPIFYNTVSLIMCCSPNQ